MYFVQTAGGVRRTDCMARLSAGADAHLCCRQMEADSKVRSEDMMCQVPTAGLVLGTRRSGFAFRYLG